MRYGKTDRKGRWQKYLKNHHPRQIQLGLIRIRESGITWAPEVPAMLAYFKLRPEDLGWPSPENAWEESDPALRPTGEP